MGDEGLRDRTGLAFLVPAILLVVLGAVALAGLGPVAIGVTLLAALVLTALRRSLPLRNLALAASRLDRRLTWEPRPGRRKDRE
jgi:ribose/xylose/arabinose/galactoside ABC-type transport system permease subunit